MSLITASFNQSKKRKYHELTPLQSEDDESTYASSASGRTQVDEYRWMGGGGHSQSRKIRKLNSETYLSPNLDEKPSS
jgi:hypothetical protein